MEVYFVRHGQTVGNQAKRHQAEESHLTPLGKQQARSAAEQIAPLQPTEVWVSDRVRAIETAQIIAEAAGLTSHINPVFTELCRPEKIYGYHHRSLPSLWYIYQWYRGKAGAEGCSEAGESYDHFFRRVKAAQRFLESQPAEARVVVVSHSIFINFFLALIHNDASPNFFRAALIFAKIFRIKNGSVVRLQYDAKVNQDAAWKELPSSE